MKKIGMVAAVLIGLCIAGCGDADGGPSGSPGGGGGGGGTSSPTVTGVTIVTGAGSITKHASSAVTETYTATVAGDNGPSQGVTWSIESNPTGVSIDADGVLTVEPAADTGTITIKAASTVAGYTDKSGTKGVTINDPDTATAADFKTEANANLLGLYPGSGGYGSAGALIDAMEDRADKATKTPLVGSHIFYNPATAGTSFSHGSWPGGAPTTCGSILGNAPRMRWIVNGNNLVYYGESTTNGVTITFNVAVIRISDGYGWIYGPDTDYATDPDLENVVKETYNYVSDVRTISISNLTNGTVSDVTGLGTEYKVYIIVRMTDGKTAAGDFNTSYGTRNVITVHPEPTYTSP